MRWVSIAPLGNPLVPPALCLSFVNLNSLGSAMGKRMGAGAEKYASEHVFGRVFLPVNRVNRDILRGCIIILAE